MKTLTIIISILLGVILFMPKENLFFTLQKELSKQNIYINTKTSSNLLSLNLSNSTIFVDKMDLAKIKQTNILPLIFFNKIELNKISINFNNLQIKHLNIIYSILDPFKIKIDGNSNFANITGIINLKNHKLKIYLLNLTNNTIKSFLKKDKKGYFYVQTF